MLYKPERAAPAKRSSCPRQLPAPAASPPWSPPQGFPLCYTAWPSVGTNSPGLLRSKPQAGSRWADTRGTAGMRPGSGEVWQAGGGPSGSVPSVLLAGLSIFPLIPAPAPNSSELIHSLLRLPYAAQTEDQRSLAPAGTRSPSLADCFREAERSQAERPKRG